MHKINQLEVQIPLGGDQGADPGGDHERDRGGTCPKAGAEPMDLSIASEKTWREAVHKWSNKDLQDESRR